MTGVLWLLAAAVATAVVALVMGRIVWARPRDVYLGDGRLYQWKRNPDCPFVALQWKNGSFYHPDGTPVTDPAVRRALEEKWKLRFKSDGSADYSA